MGQTETPTPADVAPFVPRQPPPFRQTPHLEKVDPSVWDDEVWHTAARIVHRVLGVVGPAVAGEPDPGIAVQLQQLPRDRQRAIFHDLLRWPGAYYLTPAGGRGGQPVIVIRWRHHHPDVKVTFLADAVADRDDSGIWQIEPGLLP